MIRVDSGSPAQTDFNLIEDFQLGSFNEEDPQKSQRISKNLKEFERIRKNRKKSLKFPKIPLSLEKKSLKNPRTITGIPKNHQESQKYPKESRRIPK